MNPHRYVNERRGIDINVEYLSAEERNFYRTALQYFHQNPDRRQFDQFAFGPQSPIYRSHCSSFIHDSLYTILRDMWFQLGVQQGMCKEPQK